VLRRWQEGTDLQLATLREEIGRLRAEAAAAQVSVSVREATTGRAVVDGLATVVTPPHPPANDSARPEPPPPRPVDTFIGRMPDDLTVIMGVDFEVAALLRASGIRTWSDLARRTPERLRILLASTGGAGAERDPSSWPEQARLATAGRWRQLRQMQNRLAQARR
jgi:predicted flap endonuclease-1-like 5' DNA nuclease